MTCTREFVIWCDGCGAWERTLSLTPAAFRRVLRQRGWVKTRVHDLCPACVSKKASALEALIRCEDAHHQRGWVVVDGRVRRCEVCGKFADDDTVIDHVREFADGWWVDDDGYIFAVDKVRFENNVAAVAAVEELR